MVKGNPTEKSREYKKASKTALMAAIHRFMATRETESGHQGTDHLAYIFLPAKAGFFLSITFFRGIFLRKLHEKVPGSYPYITARTKFFDEIFLQSLQENIPQIVFLGAGYDTRAIRFQQFNQQTRIIELDEPMTQNDKKRRLEKHKIQIPENLLYVPINFTREDLESTLLQSGYDPDKKTLFICEGVTMYLPPEVVEGMLSFITHHSGKESILVFDYFYESVIQGTSTDFGADKLTESANSAGEPFKFGIRKGKAKEFLDVRGFTIIRHYFPEEFMEKYLDKYQKSWGKIYGFVGNVVAKLKDG